MVVDASGDWWTGTAAEDVAEYLRAYKPGGYEVGDVQIVGPCSSCGSAAGYRLQVDDEQGYAERVCESCQHSCVMLDSADVADVAEPIEAGCPCGGVTFDVGVGFSLREDGDVRWVSIGMRCHDDGVLGVYTDWKIDYSPTDGLRARV